MESKDIVAAKDFTVLGNGMTSARQDAAYLLFSAGQISEEN